MNRRTLILVAFLLLGAGALLGYVTGRSSRREPAVTTTTTSHSEGEHGAEHAAEEGAHAEHAEESHGEHAGHDEHGESEGEEHAEGQVRLTPEQQKEAGVTVVPVRAREVEGSFQATGEITGAPDLQVRVNARLGGRVVSLLAEPGERVASGATLAVLESPEVAQARSARRAAGIRLEQARRAYEQRRRLVELGDEVRSAIEEARQEVVQATADTRGAQASLDLARQQLDRLTGLRQEGIASRQQVEQAQAEFRRAQAELESARARLRIAEGHLAREEAIRSEGLRVSREVTEAETEVRLAEEGVRQADEVLELLGVSPGTGDNTVAITAPRGGVVTARPVTLGETVEVDEELFTLMETSRLWLEVGIPERELPRARVGSTVRVRVAAHPDRVFTGRIASIAPGLAPQTRTATARVTLENPGNLLRPGMFASVAVGSGVTGGTSAAVPESALQTVENRPVVYVAVNPETFQRRPVQLGAKEEGWVQVVRGLSPGEKVAATGAFFLKSEDQRETMGGHSH